MSLTEGTIAPTVPDGTVRTDTPSLREVDARLEASYRIDELEDRIRSLLETWAQLRHGWRLVELFYEVVADEGESWRIMFASSNQQGKITATHARLPFTVELGRSTATKFSLVVRLTSSAEPLVSVSTMLVPKRTGKKDWANQDVLEYSVEERCCAELDLTTATGRWVVDTFLTAIGRYFAADRPEPLRLEP